MQIQPYYEPQENGEYMYIEVDKHNPGAKPIVGPEYFELFSEVERRYATGHHKLPLQLMPRDAA